MKRNTSSSGYLFVGVQVGTWLVELYPLVFKIVLFDDVRWGGSKSVSMIPTRFAFDSLVWYAYGEDVKPVTMWW
jgi:hypothetical protein